ncbi:MAG: hypothetical protein ACMXYC_03640 [Candidatus Woesearchaeota archaeon]
MGERLIVVEPKNLSYTGYFKLNELYYIIEKWLKEMGYDKKEKEHDVMVYPEGKTIFVRLIPDKSVSEFIKHVIEIKLHISNLKDVTITVDGKQTAVQEGKINIMIRAIQEGDQENRFTQPFWYFMRLVIDKYLFANFINDHTSILKDDVHMLYTEMSAYLNINKYRFK